MGFPTLVPLCGPIRVTYAPVGDTPILDISLLRIKDSKDCRSVGGLVVTFADRPNGHSPLDAVDGINDSDPSFLQFQFVKTPKVTLEFG